MRPFVACVVVGCSTASARRRPRRLEHAGAARRQQKFRAKLDGLQKTISLRVDTARRRPPASSSASRLTTRGMRRSYWTTLGEVDGGRLCRKGNVLALVAQVDVVPSSARLILRSFHSCARPMAMVAPKQGEASFLFGSDDECGSDVDAARLAYHSLNSQSVSHVYHKHDYSMIGGQNHLSNCALQSVFTECSHRQ